MVYADNQAGPNSPCTPAVYHACIAYGTADSPLGPWTYQGVILDPVSSTTSHPGVIEFKGQWYLVYHTADAKGGGHFRRSVAIDKIEWDDSVKPARMLKVVQTHEPQPPPQPTRNIAMAAHPALPTSPSPSNIGSRASTTASCAKIHSLRTCGAAGHVTTRPEQWIEYAWSGASGP